MTTLSKRFMEGLKNYDLSYDEIIESKWRYCGGDSGRHQRYFKLSCPKDDIPEKQDECVCGHKIKENCYITDGSRILVLGNCCIKRFIPLSTRTCDECGAPHKNRKQNKCNDCKVW